MSQHHLTVQTIHGTTLKLVAGWDWPLRQFFLSLTDMRITTYEPGDELLPEGLTQMTAYDSTETLDGLRGFRSIGDVEHQLNKHGIPFSFDHELERRVYAPDSPIVFNTRLLPLLCELLNEQDGERPKLDQKLKLWDQEPEGKTISELEVEHEKQQRFETEYNKRYTTQAPHSLYTVDNWNTWVGKLPNDQITELRPYEQWVRMNIADCWPE